MATCEICQREITPLQNRLQSGLCAGCYDWIGRLIECAKNTPRKMTERIRRIELKKKMKEVNAQ